jgi:hypothetical protein
MGVGWGQRRSSTPRPATRCTGRPGPSTPARSRRSARQARGPATGGATRTRTLGADSESESDMGLGPARPRRDEQATAAAEPARGPARPVRQQVSRSTWQAGAPSLCPAVAAPRPAGDWAESSSGPGTLIRHRQPETKTKTEAPSRRTARPDHVHPLRTRVRIPAGIPAVFGDRLPV